MNIFYKGQFTYKISNGLVPEIPLINFTTQNYLMTPRRINASYYISLRQGV